MRGGGDTGASGGERGAECGRGGRHIKQGMEEENHQEGPWGLVGIRVAVSPTTAPLHHKHSEL